MAYSVKDQLGFSHGPAAEKPAAKASAVVLCSRPCLGQSMHTLGAW